MRQSLTTRSDAERFRRPRSKSNTDAVFSVYTAETAVEQPVADRKWKDTFEKVRLFLQNNDEREY